MKKFDIASALPDEIGEFVEGFGVQRYRSRQIFGWIHGRRVRDFGEMTNLSRDFRGVLVQNAEIALGNIAEKMVAADKNTIKYLFRLGNSYIMKDGGIFVEGVLMRHRHGLSLCVSSQAGCRMDCAFCASAKGGLIRNLSPGEMAAQIYAAEADCGERISNVVIMGMGEPLDNFDNTVKFIQLITHPDGANMAARQITLSTCGIIPKIRQLGELGLQITLAISLHAPNDTIRRKIMPIAKAHPMEDLLATCAEYANKNRRITFEYAMIAGINDSAENATELAARLRPIFCHVNLLSINQIEGGNFKPSKNADIEIFGSILEKNGINVTIRKSRGGDINAACGQLRNTRRDCNPKRLKLDEVKNEANHW
ncbi:MAG: 23S rRNA (adenine(2503)-C(2))-methyltransferase RlmN [Defluviitaleaceae bacterium]|nr:23S rRNA (adenine(2503)-C(2))-methyltransferase RlmN [Defluviitaleaceae bacterium]